MSGKSEDKIVGSFNLRAEGASGPSNVFDKLKDFKVSATPKVVDTSLGAKQAKRPPTVGEVKKNKVEAQRPSAIDLLDGYDGKANKEKYAEKIEELMKQGIPSKEEIGLIFPPGLGGDKLYRAMEKNYPIWIEQLKLAISVEKKKETKAGGEKLLSEEELHRKYDNVVGKRFYADKNGGHWIKASSDLLTDRFRIFSSKPELNQKEIGWKELDELLKEYHIQFGRESRRKGEATANLADRQDKGSLNYEGALSSIESQKNKIIGVVKESSLSGLTKRKLENLFERLKIRVPKFQEKAFERMDDKHKAIVIEALIKANQEIEEALYVQAGISAAEETPEQKAERIKREQADMEMTRTAAMFTLAKISNVEELWGRNEKEGNEKFADKTRELWKKFAVHGKFGKDPKTGEIVLIEDTDLDGKVSLGLLKAAGLDIRDLKYVHPGTYEEGRLMIDSGGRHGASFEMGPDDEVTLFFDHHGEGSGNDTSSAEITYKILLGLGLMKKDPLLDKVVKFTSQADNWTFPNQEIFFNKSNRTVLGLYRYIKFDKLLEFAKGNKKFTDPLKRQELKDLGLEKDSKDQGYRVGKSLKSFEKLEKNGQVFHSSKYGRVVVSINNELPGKYDAARYLGCDTFVEWNPKKGSFFIYSDKVIGDDFGEGVKVRDKMWLRPPKKGQPVITSLGEILQKIGGDDFHPLGELAEYLKSEANRVEYEKKKREFRSDFEEEYPESEKPKESLLESMEDAVRRRQELNAEDIKKIEKERLLFELYQEFAQKFWVLFRKNAMAEFEKWGYNEKDRRRMLENQTRAYLKRKMEEKNDFPGAMEEQVDRIMETVPSAIQA